MAGTAAAVGILKKQEYFKGKDSFPSLSVPVSLCKSPDVRLCTRSLWFGSLADKMQSTDSHSVEEVGEVESNPASKAIARHLGIDISAEGRLAKNRKGIAIIVHGTPLSGIRRSLRGDCEQRYHDSSIQNRGNLCCDQGRS